jgi:anti-sigma B factor antagonist
MALDYTSSKVDSVTLVTLEGVIVAGEPVDLLLRKTQELLEAGERNFILDLAAVKFVDSTGIGALIDLVASASRKEGSLKLLNVTERLHEVIQITQRIAVFEIYDDLQKAIASFTPARQAEKLAAPSAPQAEEHLTGRKPLRTGFYEDEETRDGRHRRKDHRWNIPVPVRVKGTQPDGSEFEEETVTMDVSATGMSMFMNASAPIGGQVFVAAPEEQFESTATVIDATPVGPHRNRLRVVFPKQKKFTRALAEKKYVYDYSTDTWVAYITQGTYYNTKHLPFGKVEDSRILSFDSGELLFRMRMDRVFDLRMNCIGHII